MKHAGFIRHTENIKSYIKHTQWNTDDTLITLTVTTTIMTTTKMMMNDDGSGCLY